MAKKKIEKKKKPVAVKKVAAKSLAVKAKKPAPKKAAKIVKPAAPAKKPVVLAKAVKKPEPAPVTKLAAKDRAKLSAKVAVVAPAAAKKPAKLAAAAPVETKAKKAPPAVVEVLVTKKSGKVAGAKKSSSGSGALSRKRCREPLCDNDPLISGFCRLHYIKNWRKIKRKEAILATGQLNNYVEELVHKYPEKYLDVIRQDLASEKDWAKVVVDLELETGDEEASGDEETESVAAEGVRRDRDFDDEGDAF